MKRTPLRRKTPLRQVGRKAHREQPDLDAFRAAVHARRWCEAGPPACLYYRHEGHHAHHICPADRDRGLHDPERGLLLCAEAHRWVHGNPAAAGRRGWLLRDGEAA